MLPIDGLSLCALNLKIAPCECGTTALNSKAITGTITNIDLDIILNNLCVLFSNTLS
jgi:hypothetical protein